MKTIKVFVERASDGNFSAYMPEQSLSFGVIGEGKTAVDAMNDFMNVVNDYVSDGETLPPGAEFAFCYDVPSFLAYYKNKITLTGLGTLTGINPKQLNHYVTGVRKPSPRTVKKIEKSLHEFGKELCQLEFA